MYLKTFTLDFTINYLNTTIVTKQKEVYEFILCKSGVVITNNLN
jgi:hypothetical protein